MRALAHQEKYLNYKKLHPFQQVLRVNTNDTNKSVTN